MSADPHTSMVTRVRDISLKEAHLSSFFSPSIPPKPQDSHKNTQKYLSRPSVCLKAVGGDECVNEAEERGCMARRPQGKYEWTGLGKREEFDRQSSVYPMSCQLHGKIICRIPLFFHG